MDKPTLAFDRISTWWVRTSARSLARASESWVKDRFAIFLFTNTANIINSIGEIRHGVWKMKRCFMSEARRNMTLNVSNICMENSFEGPGGCCIHLSSPAGPGIVFTGHFSTIYVIVATAWKSRPLPEDHSRESANPDLQNSWSSRTSVAQGPVVACIRSEAVRLVGVRYRSSCY